MTLFCCEAPGIVSALKSQKESVVIDLVFDCGHHSFVAHCVNMHNNIPQLLYTITKLWQDYTLPFEIVLKMSNQNQFNQNIVLSE